MKLKLNKMLAAAAAVASLAASGSALAIASLNTGGGQTWHFTNWETRIVQDTSGNFNTLEGLIRVDQIFDANGNTLFSSNANEEIVGYFTGINVLNFTEALGAAFNFSGGQIKLWYDTTPDFNPSLNPVVGSGGPNGGTGVDHGTVYAPNASPVDQAVLGIGAVGSGVIDGALFADIILDTGMNLTVPAATLAGGIRNLVAADDGFGATALQGDGASFGSIIGGSSFATYNTNGYNGGKSDFRLDNTFFITALTGAPFVNDTTNGWATHSDDPVKLNAIPEPASLALVGLGLLGLGALRRRRS